jgi:signal transduction histidine kinase
MKTTKEQGSQPLPNIKRVTTIKAKIMESTRCKILLLEDDRLDQKAFTQMVVDNKLLYDYTIVDSVSEAKNILDTERFDVVIADYLLGDGTAFDILDSVENTAVIFVTGAGDEEIAVKAWKAGAKDYLIKDCEHNYLKVLPIRIENAVRHQKTEEKLKEYHRLKNRLAVTVSQELRNSLCIFSVIVSNAKVGVLGPVSNELGKNLETADRAINRLAKTISDFLDISKIEAGEIQPRRVAVNIQEIISEAISSLTESTNKEKKIKLSSSLPPDMSLAIYADPSLIKQIFVNLIDNVVKFSPMGSTICLTAQDLESEVQFNLQNTRIEVGCEDIRNIFNRFIESDGYVGPGSSGTGLGLHIAKQLIVMHGGRIWAESTPGQGCIFCFTLPKYSERIDTDDVEPVEISQESQK